MNQFKNCTFNINTHIVYTLLKGLFCMLAIWFGIWLIELDKAMVIPRFFGGMILGAAGVRLIVILVKELW